MFRALLICLFAAGLAGDCVAAPVTGAPAGTAVAESGAAGGGAGILIVYCLLVAASSWVGGILPSLVRLTHTRLQILISLIGGLMLGVGLLHQLPHAVIVMQDAGMSHALDRSLQWMLGGLTVMFFMLRMFHFHQHDAVEPEGLQPVCHHHDHDRDHHHSHDHDHSHDHSGDTGHGHSSAGRRHVHGTSWMGIAFGLSLHTLIDGLALAAHVQADTLHAPGVWLPGLGTFLGIALHKPLDSLSITSLMTAGGSTPRARLLVNSLYCLLCPLGALCFYFGLKGWSGQEGLIVGAALAFSAGVFVCIALSDLLPEVEFHSHDRLPLSLALLAGLALSWAIGLLEPEHSHGGATSSGENAIDHAGHDHAHDHSHDHDH